MPANGRRDLIRRLKVNLLKELRLYPKASHNYHRVNDETGFNLLELLQYMRNNKPICTRPGNAPHERVTSTSHFFAPAKSITATTCLLFFDSADVKLLIPGRILGSNATP